MLGQRGVLVGDADADGGEAGASSASTTSCGEPQPKKSMAPAKAPGSVAGLFDRDGGPSDSRVGDPQRPMAPANSSAGVGPATPDGGELTSTRSTVMSTTGDLGGGGGGSPRAKASSSSTTSV